MSTTEERKETINALAEAMRDSIVSAQVAADNAIAFASWGITAADLGENIHAINKSLRDMTQTSPQARIRMRRLGITLHNDEAT